MFKRMIPLVVLCLLVAFLVLWWPALSPAQTAPAAKIELKILFAGTPGTARQKEFVEFLQAHFTQVDTADVAKLRAQDADKCDVLLIDAAAKAGAANALDVPRLSLPDNFSKPTVTIGVMGGLFTSGRGLKTGYL